MCRLATTLLLGALLTVGGLVVATPAAACSCAVPLDDTAYYFDTADIVFTGRLISREVSHPDWPMVSSGDPALHVFAVDEVFKGAVHEEQGVVSADSGATCGLELAGEGPFVVYATESDGGFTAGLCDGTAPATPGMEAELRSLAETTPGADAAPLPGQAGTEGAGLPTAAYAVGGLVLVLAGALLLRRRRMVR